MRFLSAIIIRLINNAALDDPIRQILDEMYSDDEVEILDVSIKAAEEDALPQPPEVTLATTDFIDDFNKLTLEEEEEREMLPPTHCPSIVDSSEEVKRTRSSTELDPFRMAFALWCLVSGMSRHDYESYQMMLYSSISSIRQGETANVKGGRRQAR